MARTVPEGIVGYSALQTIWSAFINYVDLHIRSKHGNGAPTTTTEGKIQQFYIDDMNQKIYRCTAVNGNSYTWTAITATDPNAASHIANETIHVTNTQKNDWNNKQNNISDLESIRSGAALGATALQSAPVTSVNNKTGAISLTASDVGALPSSTVIPAAPGELITNATTAQTTSSGQSMSGNITLHKISKTGNYNDLLNKPTIPSAVTESTVSGWGFTKNTGTYIKPSNGIPSTDLADGAVTEVKIANNAVSTMYTATIPHLSSSWTEQGGFPFCAITVNGLLVSDNPIIDVLVDFENPNIVQAVEDWGLCLSAFIYADNTLVVVFSDIPSVDIPIKILCIRK